MRQNSPRGIAKIRRLRTPQSRIATICAPPRDPYRRNGPPPRHGRQTIQDGGRQIVIGTQSSATAARKTRAAGARTTFEQELAGRLDGTSPLSCGKFEASSIYLLVVWDCAGAAGILMRWPVAMLWISGG